MIECRGCRYRVNNHRVAWCEKTAIAWLPIKCSRMREKGMPCGPDAKLREPWWGAKFWDALTGGWS